MDKNFISKFNFVTNLIILALLVFGGVIWADTNGIWHRAEDVVAGTFASDEGGGDFAFPENLNVSGTLNLNSDVCLGDGCHATWQSVCESWIVSNAIN